MPVSFSSIRVDLTKKLEMSLIVYSSDDELTCQTNWEINKPKTFLTNTKNRLPDKKKKWNGPHAERSCLKYSPSLLHHQFFWKKVFFFFFVYNQVTKKKEVPWNERIS